MSSPCIEENPSKPLKDNQKLGEPKVRISSVCFARLVNRGKEIAVPDLQFDHKSLFFCIFTPKPSVFYILPCENRTYC